MDHPRHRTHLLSLLLVLALALGLGACGRAQETPSAEPTPAATTSPSPEAEAADPEAQATPDGRPTRAGDLPPAQRADMFTEPPPMVIDPNKVYYATIQTEKGDIVVQLFADRAPQTVNNFVFLARQGFYDDTTFHRVLEGFMAQGGDPTGTGMGGPGYTFPDEFVPGLVFDRPGLLAMANAGPNTNGSQFFITYAPTDWLNYRHTIFGQVIQGMEVLESLTPRDPQQNPDFQGDRILTIQIEEREESVLPTPTPLPPTPTPFPPSALAPSDLTAGERPLAALEPAARSNYFNTPPEMVIDTSRTYTATLVTSKGTITLALADDLAPVAVNNFVLLAALGFYDGTPVNDVVSGQGLIFGAPANEPASHAGYFFEPEVGVQAAFGPGTVAYLPARDPRTGTVLSNSSQLAILFNPPDVQTASQISAFGQVVDGIDVLQALTTDDVIERVDVQVE